MKFKCKIGLHNWTVCGWSRERRFDVCLCCYKDRWVDDKKGYDKMMKEVEYWTSTAGIRERRLGKLLDK